MKCCRWHNALDQVAHGIRSLNNKHGGGCRDLWFPSFGWQCGTCFSLNDTAENDFDHGDDKRECAYCGGNHVLCDSTNHLTSSPNSEDPIPTVMSL